jgi:hypothetical protein
MLCIANMTEGPLNLQKALGHGTTQWNKWLDFLKLYLTMEEWFCDCNEKDEVNNARQLIANVLVILQELFPRDERGNESCIPKMHGRTKFQSYVKMNFLEVQARLLISFL